MWLHRVLAPFLVSFAAASPAFAQDDASVAKAYDNAAKGLKAFDEDRPAEALSKFSAAYAIMKLPSIALFMARAEAKLGHLVAAAALCDQALGLEDGLGDPEVQEKARQQAKLEREALEQRIPRLVVTLVGAFEQSVSIRIDSVPVISSSLQTGMPVDPGTHSIAAQSGNQLKELQVTLAEGETRTISLRFEPAPAPIIPVTRARTPESTAVTGNDAMRTAAWVSIGAGGAALALWGTTSLWALAKAHDLDKAGAWSVKACDRASDPSKCNDYRQLRAISTASFYVGLVGIATGATLFILAPAEKRKQRGGVPRLNATVTLGGLELEGTF